MARGGERSRLGRERGNAEAAQLDLGLIILRLERVLADPYAHPAAQALAAEAVRELRKNQGDWATHLIRLNTLVGQEHRPTEEE